MVVSLITPLTARERIESEGFSLKGSPGVGLCWIKGCRNRHAGPKKKLGEVMFCHRHWQQRWRKRDYKEASWATLRDHAKARGIGFTLSFEKFVQITDECGYWDQQPETDADRLTVDRILMSGAYSDDNVRVIPKGLNSGLSNRERWLPENVKAILARKRADAQAAAWTMSGPREDSWLD